MNKLKEIECTNITTGEIIDNEIIESIFKEKHKNNIKNLYYKLDNAPDNMNIEEIRYIAKIENISLDRINSFDSYHIINADFDKLLFEKNLTPTTYYYFNKLVAYYCSCTYTLQYKNNKNIVKDIDIAEILGIKERAWGYIKSDLIKYNLIKMVNLGKEKAYKINPCYIGKRKIMTPNTYYAFRDDIIKNNLMSSIQILYWDKLLLEDYGVKLEEPLISIKG